MKLSIKIILLFTLLLSEKLFSQCSIPSSNGWTVTIDITPKAIIPEFTNCPTYYHYEVRFDYTITFTGSTNGRNFNANAYFKCTGGTGNDIYYSLGNFTSNSSGTRTTSNNARQFNAPYSASNPTCTAVTLAHANCTSVRLDYWGTNLSGNTTNCNFSSPLPIELFEFTAKQKDNKIVLNWATASELNNDFFTIEKSADAVNWKEIGTVKGAGTTNIRQDYSFTDETTNSGISYYRLKQTDFNKEYKYSYVIDVHNLFKKHDYPVLYPNPTQDYIFSSTNEIKGISIINVVGDIIINEANFNKTIGLNISALSKGIYFAEIKNNDGSYIIEKIIKE